MSRNYYNGGERVRLGSCCLPQLCTLLLTTQHKGWEESGVSRLVRAVILVVGEFVSSLAPIHMCMLGSHLLLFVSNCDLYRLYYYSYIWLQVRVVLHECRVVKWSQGQRQCKCSQQLNKASQAEGYSRDEWCMIMMLTAAMPLMMSAGLYFYDCRF